MRSVSLRLDLSAAALEAAATAAPALIKGGILAAEEIAQARQLAATAHLTTHLATALITQKASRGHRRCSRERHLNHRVAQGTLLSAEELVQDVRVALLGTASHAREGPRIVVILIAVIRVIVGILELCSLLAESLSKQAALLRRRLTIN